MIKKNTYTFIVRDTEKKIMLYMRLFVYLLESSLLIKVNVSFREIGALCRSRKIFFHTDAAQAVGKIPISVNEQNIDLMSIR